MQAAGPVARAGRINATLPFNRNVHEPTIVKVAGTTPATLVQFFIYAYQNGRHILIFGLYPPSASDAAAQHANRTSQVDANRTSQVVARQIGRITFDWIDLVLVTPTIKGTNNLVVQAAIATLVADPDLVRDVGARLLFAVKAQIQVGHALPTVYLAGGTVQIAPSSASSISASCGSCTPRPPSRGSSSCSRPRRPAPHPCPCIQRDM